MSQTVVSIFSIVNYSTFKGGMKLTSYTVMRSHCAYNCDPLEIRHLLEHLTPTNEAPPKVESCAGHMLSRRSAFQVPL
eukprot:1445163-Amphidinium_carterae.2